MIVCAPAALLAYRIGRITPWGVLVGAAIGGIVYAAFYLAGLSVLATALALTLITSHAGRTRGDERHRGEQRSSANILANCGIGAAAAVIELLPLDLSPDLTALWFVAATSAGASDTVASEIGKAFGGQPRTFPDFRPATPGTPGAVSVVGTLAGALAAAVIAAPAVWLWLLAWPAVPWIVAGCVVGSFVESALATAFESRGLIGNHALNLLNTGTASAVVLLWWASA